MALHRDEDHDTLPSDLRDDDRPGEYLYDSDDGRSNFVAFLLGGVVITGGLLTFLYYDTGTLQASEPASGYLSRLESPVGATDPKVPQTAQARVVR